MYSSSASTASTEPIDQRWTLPVPKEALKECYPDKSYNIQPLEFKHEGTSDNISICKDKEKPGIEDYRCKKYNEIVREWMTETFSKNTRTLEDILREEIEMKKKNRKLITKLSKNKSIWCTDKSESHKNLPYVGRYFSFPRIIINLGCDFVHYKSINEFIRCGIKLFLFDLRFTTEKRRAKLKEHIRYAKYHQNSLRNTEALFASFCLISGRELITGINQHDVDIYIERDSKIILTADRFYSIQSNHKVIYVNFSDYVKKLMKEDIIEIGGEIKVQVKNEYMNSVECIVIKDGLLKSKSKIKIPTIRTLGEPPQLTTEEEVDIMQAFRMGCDFIILPYPFSPNLITFIHWVTAARHRTAKLFVKINLQLTHNLSEEELYSSLENFSGVYLLLNKLEEITPILRNIFRVCLARQKTIIWGGIFDEDVENTLIPDDDELKKFMFLYSDALTIKTKDPYGRSKLQRFIRDNYPEMNKLNLHLSCKLITQMNLTIENVLLRYMILASLNRCCSCIIITNNSGKTVIQIAKQRPIIPLISSVCDTSNARRNIILRNVYSLMYYSRNTSTWDHELEIRLALCVEFGKEMGFINNHDPFIYCFDSKRGITFSDSYRILSLDNL